MKNPRLWQIGKLVAPSEFGVGTGASLAGHKVFASCPCRKEKPRHFVRISAGLSAESRDRNRGMLAFAAPDQYIPHTVDGAVHAGFR